MLKIDQMIFVVIISSLLLSNITLIENRIQANDNFTDNNDFKELKSSIQTKVKSSSMNGHTKNTTKSNNYDYNYNLGNNTSTPDFIHNKNNRIPKFQKNIHKNLNNVEPSTFVSKWNNNISTDSGTPVKSIELPLQQTGTYNFTIDWGDGKIDRITSWNQTEVRHNYDKAGIFTIKIDGELNGWRFNNGGDRHKIIEIIQWGDLQFGNLGDYFEGCVNLKLTATDAPDLSETTNLQKTFSKTGSLGSNGSMEAWDISNITSLFAMFSGATSFNQSLSSWNTSGVTTMVGMFIEAKAFNQPIGNWDVSNVKSMEKMFSGALSFNQSLKKWNVSRVNNMAYLFGELPPAIIVIPPNRSNNYGTFQNSIPNEISFNQPIGNWDVSSVTDMEGMFNQATSFDQPIGSWNVSKVTTMDSMFYGASSFNQSLHNWDVSNVIEMDEMFRNAKVFNQPLNNWNVSAVTDFGMMFKNAINFNQPISSWSTSNILSIREMFFGATAFNQPIDSWDVTSVIDMRGIFNGASSFNKSLNSWNLMNVRDVSAMFSGATSFNRDIGSWDVSRVINMSLMFAGASSFDQDIGNWDVGVVGNMSRMFFKALSFEHSIAKWDISIVDDMTGMFKGVKLPTQIYDAMLINWAQLNLEFRIIFSAGISQYSIDANASRNYIIENFGWRIIDGGLQSNDQNGENQTKSDKTSDEKNTGINPIKIPFPYLTIIGSLFIITIFSKYIQYNRINE